MSDKYQTADHYSRDVTTACETALVMLMQAFGTYKTHLRLIGGLVPKYLVKAVPPEVPLHVGTTDVDVVLDVAILAVGEDYRTLRDQLKTGGFQRVTKEDGAKSSWQWECAVSGVTIVVEFLVDAPLGVTGLQPLAGEEISACRIPHAGMASQWYGERTLRVQMPNGDGIATETIRHADPVTFLALKGLAMQNRQERKDVADFIYVLRHCEGAPHSLAEVYAYRLSDQQHAPGLRAALDLLHKDFCDDEHTEGYRKTGPGRYVNFHGMTDADERAREQRNISGMVNEFLELIEATGAWQRTVAGT